MLRKDLVAAVSKRTGVRRDDAEAILLSVFDVIVEAVESNESVVIRGFGEFYPAIHASRRVVPVTGNKERIVPPWRMIRFRPHGSLMERIKAK